MRALLVIALACAGCGSYVGSARSQAPAAPGAEDPDISIERPEKPEPQVNDPNAEHITMDGEEANTGPTDIVTSPPERPPMPSMLPGVLTGPAGAAPITVDEDAD
jgi:hypothetical protein